MAEANKKIVIAIFRGDEKLDEVSFKQDTVSIGSLPSCTLVLEDEGIAEEHAALSINEDGDLILADNSNGGTQIHGRPVKRKAFVESGDEIVIADYRLVVTLSDDAPAPEAPAPRAPEPAAPAPEPAAPAPEAAASQAEDEEDQSFAPADLTLTLIPQTTSDDRKGERILEVREILWGDTLFKVDQYYKFSRILFGEAKRTNYFIPSDKMPSDAFPMIRNIGGGLELNITDTMEGYLERDGQKTDLSELRTSGLVTQSSLSNDVAKVYSLNLQTDDLALVSVGPVSFYMRQVSRGQLLKESLLKALNYSLLVILLLCAFAIGGLFITATLTYVEGEERDFFDIDDRFAKVIMTPEQKEEKPDIDKKAPPKKALLRQGKKSVGKEGKVGKRDSKVAMSKGTPRKAINDEEVASSSGILGLLSSSADQDLNAVFGGGGLGGSLDKNLGGLAGPSGVDMRGTGGLGLRGTGTGGGGTGLGIGGIGTWGRGGGRAGYGSGRGRLGGHRRSDITTAAAAAVVKGALAKSVIAAVIRRYYNRIKYCYQKELTRNPNLYGKIKVYFVIAGNGTVKEARVSQTTMNNRNVEDCVCSVIRQIRFPKPKGGGIVVVKFPFVFRSTE